ncbi:hypothetical protein VOLCADRAFT_102925 [Volvox carteri f. nagariensis]|uniref:Peroxisomal membrane MPV17/PMP22-like protein n=1 Tax=Volvox carteri f. nagariensis TaxID=3068 RepID=D8TGV3_VOLCA|nr:uncharacterized protein VOLCADRAFT_102925 [Volvox carteri f. nagariensis]EFJ52964.1 hypothetical protein VOLCADRAFT_102925 [Volvox carteri f. nagariensis]|eukprot:XP_002945969.1 hypothetical protein VOLCADRAFT_102925 [Volvox carteri f. nagariensis]
MASISIARSLFRSCLQSSVRRVRHCNAVANVGRPRPLPVGKPVAPVPGARSHRRMSCRAAENFGGGGGGSTAGKQVGSGGSGEPHKPSGSSGGLWAWYMNCLETNPLFTKALTCALLNALGDIFCQFFIEGGKWDIRRTSIFTFMGLALVGPTLHYWYSLLNRLIPARGATGAGLQLLLDQGVFAPLFLATFISVLFTIEGKSHLVRSKLEQDLLETVKVNWVLWIPAQYLNFRFVPPNLQVLTANIVALIWNTYMSFQSHKAVAQPQPKH